MQCRIHVQFRSFTAVQMIVCHCCVKDNNRGDYRMNDGITFRNIIITNLTTDLIPISAHYGNFVTDLLIVVFYKLTTSSFRRKGGIQC